MDVGIIVAAFAAISVLLIAFGVAGARQEDPLKARLNQLGQMTAKDLQELELQQPFFDRTIKPLAGRLSGAVARVTSSSFSERTEKRLAMAGNPGDMKVADWLGIKAIGAGVGAGILFILFGILGGNLVQGLILALIGAVIGYVGPEFWLGGRVKKRQKAILLQIPAALVLLTISVRAGLGFDAALGKVVEKMKGPLVDEFRRALADVRVGKARREAVRGLGPRTEGRAPRHHH